MGEGESKVGVSKAEGLRLDIRGFDVIVDGLEARFAPASRHYKVIWEYLRDAGCPIVFTYPSSLNFEPFYPHKTVGCFVSYPMRSARREDGPLVILVYGANPFQFVPNVNRTKLGS